MSFENKPAVAKTGKKIVSGLVMLLMSLVLFVPTAFAGTSPTNTAFDNTTADDQTIVKESGNSNVVITNEATTPPSPTGFLTQNAPIFGLIAIVACGGVLVVLKAKRNRARYDGLSE